jgi:hypothetical protein
MNGTTNDSNALAIEADMMRKGDITGLEKRLEGRQIDM